MSIKTIMGGSKETSIAGALSGAALVFSELAKLFDNDPATNMDIAVIVSAIGMVIAFILARDNDKSSEEVGAK